MDYETKLNLYKAASFILQQKQLIKEAWGGRLAARIRANRQARRQGYRPIVRQSAVPTTYNRSACAPANIAPMVAAPAAAAPMLAPASVPYTNPSPIPQAASIPVTSNAVPGVAPITGAAPSPVDSSEYGENLFARHPIGRGGRIRSYKPDYSTAAGVSGEEADRMANSLDALYAASY